MAEASYVVVFPGPFARGRVPQLAANIREILRGRKLAFGSVRRDGDVILVDAADPVFASSAIALLFGIEKVAIARRTENDFDAIVSEITSVGGNLLLSGERFLVRVDGESRGFVPADVEIAATSSIIEKKSALGARPGTPERHDKLLYAHLTKKSAYVSIFVDRGCGGVPYGSQGGGTVCAVYDGLSAVSCYETIRQGFGTRIISCYRSRPELAGIARMLGRIIPRLVREEVDVEFYRVGPVPGGKGGYAALANIALGVLLRQPEERVSLAVSPQIFQHGFVDDSVRRALDAGKVPFLPLAGLGEGLFADAEELGAGTRGIERVIGAGGAPAAAEEAVERALATRRTVRVRVGPNNVHDILDSLYGE